MSPGEIAQTPQGIWIQKEGPLWYTTSLREASEHAIGFIPFCHPYRPSHLGTITFLDLSNPDFDFSRNGLTEGLLQNKFYPLGGNPYDLWPALTRKGLAKKIEIEIIKDLLHTFPEDTPIALAGTSDARIKYLERMGVLPFAAMPLREYLRILNDNP